MLKTLNHFNKMRLGIFLILLVCIPVSTQAQSLKRHCISSYCAISMTKGVTLEQTAGQPFNTIPDYGNSTSILPGFQQSVVLKTETLNPDLVKKLNITVYPNPAAYSVIIQCAEVIEKPAIRVIDLNGKLIWMVNPEGFLSYPINCEGWSNGIYIITISGKNLQNYSTKLIINK